MQQCSRGRALDIADADKNTNIVMLSSQSLIIFRTAEQIYYSKIQKCSVQIQTSDKIQNDEIQRKGTMSLFQCFCSKQAFQIQYEETLW